MAAKRTFTVPGPWPLSFHTWLSYLPYYYSFRRCHRGADAARAQPSRAPVALPFSRSFHPTAPMMGWNPAIGPAQRGAPSLARRTTSLDDDLDELDADDSDGGSDVMGFADTKNM